MYSLESQELRKLKPEFGQPGFLGCVCGEAERPGDATCDLFREINCNMQAPSLLEGKHHF